MKDKYLRKLNIELVDGEFENPVKEQVRGPEQIFEIFKSLKDKSQETLLGVYLTEDLEVRLYDVLSIGGKDMTLILPHEIFEHAIVTKSRMFILIHNHPQGDPKPSESDKEAMKAISEQSKVMKLSFLDFIIVGNDGYWSMFEEADGGEYSLGSIS